MNKLVWNKKGLPDMILVFTVISLLIIGLVMVYSASHIWAEYKYGDALFFVKRQLLFAVVGVVLMLVIAYIPYTFWRKHLWVILFSCSSLLILVLIPGIGLVRGGAQSWIGVGAFSIQPSEFMKLGMILFISHYLSTNLVHIKKFTKGFLPTMLIIFGVFGIIMLQPDLGTGVVLVATCVLMVFAAGVPVKYFIYLGLFGVVGFVLLIISAPYRISRITSFLNPWNDPLGDGFQIIQSLYALGPGKLMGLGYGKSLQKYFYLPEPQTDFIFAIIGEEFGFIGAVFVICLFVLLFWRGIRIALLAFDHFGRFIAIGIIAMISIQVMINVSVVIGLIPVTGITLPFLSYGGSSLTLTLAAIGVLLNISVYIKN